MDFENPTLIPIENKTPLVRYPAEHTTRYGEEPARIRYLIPDNQTDLRVLTMISNWKSAQEQMDFPDTPEGKVEWLNEGNLMLDDKGYSERSFAVCDEKGEMQAFINFFPLSPELFAEIHDQLGIEPPPEGTLDLEFACARRPDTHTPGLVASGHRQAFIQLKAMVDTLQSQHLTEHPITNIRIFGMTMPENIAPQKLNAKIGLVPHSNTFVESSEYDPPQELMLWQLDWPTLNSQMLPPLTNS